MLFKGMFHASRSQFGVILHCAPEDGRLFARLKPSPALKAHPESRAGSPGCGEPGPYRSNGRTV